MTEVDLDAVWHCGGMSSDPGSTSSEHEEDGGAPRSAGSAYLVSPEAGPGPGVLVLHSWWGLTEGMKSTVEQLADSGFTAMAPALLPGEQPGDVAEAAGRLAEADVDATAGLILSSIVALRANSADPDAPVGVVGYSMGASWALWVATRQPLSVDAVVSYYGHQDIDFADLSAAVLCHFAESDPLVTEDQAVEMQAHLKLAGKEVEAETHPGTRHFFAESGVPVLDAEGVLGERKPSEEAAAATAWLRSVDFLRSRLAG